MEHWRRYWKLKEVAVKSKVRFVCVCEFEVWSAKGKDELTFQMGQSAVLSTKIDRKINFYCAANVKYELSI